MDRIVTSLVEDLLKAQELISDGQDKDFEKFSNFSIITSEYNKSFDIHDTLTGGGDDTGIDGLAVIVNGQIIHQKEEIDSLLESNAYLEAKFLFIQSKTSNKFESSDINLFAFGVKDFFSDSPKLRRNEEINNFIDIYNHLYNKASHFRYNPDVKIFYVTNGQVNEDQNHQAIVSSSVDELRQTNLFRNIDFILMGANEISKIYRDTKNTVSTTFIFQEKVTLPELPGIIESYFGIIPMSEFKKLLIDENENLRNVFFDNVRDFQGLANPVNSHIAETLTSESPELFTVLNNGVTVVATSKKSSGNRFTINDYQIVNGCQTSNVLYNHIKSHGLDHLNIPLKLVVTDDDDIKNKITIATNSQTAVKREQLQAMTEFQKNLEYYYRSIEGDGKLFYERRSGQYQSDITIVKARILNIQNQIKSFSSIFYDNPDRVTTYFGSIVKQNVETENPIIFHPKHQLDIYYISGLAFYRLDSLFRARAIDTNYRKVKFFMLMLFRMLIQPSSLSKDFMKSSRKTKDYCSPILKVLDNKTETVKYFEKVIDIIKFSKLNVDDKQLVKQTNFTNQLKTALKNYNDFENLDR